MPTMRTVVCQEAELSVQERPVPEPGPGQVLIEVSRCGICGSDLHARRHADQLADATAEMGYHGAMRAHDAVVLGHEFSGVIVEHGPRSRTLSPVGTPVTVFPLLREDGAVHLTGLSAHAPGGYAEYVLAEESLAFPVPNGLSTEISALTEPMAVAWHAVRRGEVGKRDVAVVIGCGPVGLAVISMLKAQGVRHVIASDLSPGRRALAERCGADAVVDPREESPFTGGHGHLTDAPTMLRLAVDAMDKLRRIPVLPWSEVYRTAERLGATNPKRPVIFECVGVPGMIDQVITGAPIYSRVVVVGVCMEDDRIRPMMAINKELDLRFVLGYTPLEFRDTLAMLADGKVDPTPLITGTVGLDEVAGAFSALGDPETHAKILIDPRRTEPGL